VTSSCWLAGTDLVLAEKDALSKFAIDPGGFHFHAHVAILPDDRKVFAAIWQSDRNKSADFCVDISKGLH
jgi:hypothetical protein